MIKLKSIKIIGNNIRENDSKNNTSDGYISMHQRGYWTPKEWVELNKESIYLYFPPSSQLVFKQRKLKQVSCLIHELKKNEDSMNEREIKLYE